MNRLNVDTENIRLISLVCKQVRRRTTNLQMLFCRPLSIVRHNTFFFLLLSLSFVFCFDVYDHQFVTDDDQYRERKYLV